MTFKQMSDEEKQAYVRSLTDEQLKAVLPPHIVAFLSKHEFMFQSFRAMGEGDVQRAQQILDDNLQTITDPAEQVRMLDELQQFQELTRKMVILDVSNPELINTLRQLLGQPMAPDHEDMTPEQEQEFGRFEREGLTLQFSKDQIDDILDMEDMACDLLTDKVRKLANRERTPLQEQIYQDALQKHERAHAIGQYIRRALKASFPKLFEQADENDQRHTLH